MMPRTRRLKIIFRWFFPPGSERAKWSYALFIAAITALALFSILSWATYFVETCRAAWASHKQLEVIILTKDVFYVCTQREAKRHNIDTQIQPTSSAQTSSVFDFFTRTSKNSYTRSTLKTLPAENGVRRTSWNCYNSKQYKRRANGACVSTRKACLTPSDMLKSGNESRVQISCEGRNTTLCVGKVTVIVMTSGKGPLPALLDVLDNYRRMPIADQVLVIWNDPITPPPS
eukprot:1182768-Prorocentrum_minimum.AAC.3